MKTSRLRIPLALAAAVLAAAGCSGITDRGKKAPECKGAARPLNPQDWQLPGQGRPAPNDANENVRRRIAS